MYPQYGQQYGQFGPDPVFAPPAPTPPAAPVGSRARRRRTALVAGTSAIAVAAAVVLVEVANGGSGTIAGLGSVSSTGGSTSGTGGSSSPNGNGGYGGFGSGGGSSSGGSTSGGSTSGGSTGTTTSQGSATTAQQVGIVDVVTVLGYQSAEAAGTGMVVTSNGEIVTNNHVVDGATSIKVTVVSTGKTYTATVVGTDATDDVAVIQLQNASGLKTANFGDSGTVKVGDSVTGVGNAGGVGGTPSAASGSVQALDQTITASDDSGANAETLHGLIETNAPIQAGDSGGPLYAGAKIVGMDTAASTSASGGRMSYGDSAQTAVASTAYAIPINTALSIAAQIESGTSSSTIQQGYPAFLGVGVATDAATSTGAAISSVVEDGPAASAGITGGDVITSVNGTTVTSGSDLKTVLSKYKIGAKVTISWTDEAGASHSASVTLIQGPAA